MPPAALLGALRYVAGQLVRHFGGGGANVVGDAALASPALALQALPLLALYEHVAGQLVGAARAVADARLLRLHALTLLGYVAEAHAALAQLVRGKDLPLAHGGQIL